MSVPMKWNEDKPHRCPGCHAVTDERRVCRWKVVTCRVCQCAFTRWPRLARILPWAGVVYTQPHRNEGET